MYYLSAFSQNVRTLRESFPSLDAALAAASSHFTPKTAATGVPWLAETDTRSVIIRLAADYPVAGRFYAGVITSDAMLRADELNRQWWDAHIDRPTGLDLILIEHERIARTA